MQFYVFDPENDRIEATVFDRDLFSPNGEHQSFLILYTTIHLLFYFADFLGSTSIKISELQQDGPSPWTKRLLLEHVHTGEIEFQLQYEDIKLL